MQTDTKCSDTKLVEIPDKVRTECCNSYLTFEHAQEDKDSTNEIDYLEDCEVGYMRDDPEDDCEDIDECERGEHNCSRTSQCVNTDGSFYCDEVERKTCGDGYRLNEDGSFCEGKVT